MAGSGISIRLRRRLKALLGIETLQQRVATLEAALLDARAAAEAQTAANAKALALANQRLVTLGEQVAAARAIADRATARLAEADGQLAAIDRQLGDGRAAAIAQAATLDLLRHEVQAVNDAAQGALSLATHVDRQITRLDHDVLPAVTQRIDGVEALAGAAEQGAANAARHAVHVDGQVTRIDGALSAMAGRLAGVEGATARLGGEVESRLTAVESATAGLGGEIVRVEARLEIEAGRAQGAADAAAAAQQVAASAVTRVEHVDAQVTRLDGALARQHGEIDALGKQLIAHRAETAARLAGDERIADDLTRAVTDLAIGVKAQVQKIDDLAGLAAGAKNLADNAMARAEHVDAQVTRIDGVTAELAPRVEQALGLAPTRLYTRADAADFPLNFLITSYGYAASRWLGAALNSHPDIICTHGNNSARIGLIYDRDFTEAEWRRVWKEMPARRALSLDAFFAELHDAGKARAYGNVHHYRIDEIHRLLESKPTKTRFECIELIRHPISIIESRYQGHLDKENLNNRFDPSLRLFQDKVADYVQANGFDDIVADHGLDPATPQVAMFLLAIEGVRWMTSAIQTYPTQNFILMEKITSDPQYFALMFETLFRGKLPLPPDYLDKVFRIGHLNQHRRTRKRGTAAGDFEKWKPWQKALVLRFMERHKVPEIYRRFGYDFGFAE